VGIEINWNELGLTKSGVDIGGRHLIRITKVVSDLNTLMLMSMLQDVRAEGLCFLTF
jgi:hypothetical protein